MNKISAEIILGSENELGNKIVTWKLTFPRIILAEFNTHRMVSKNSASSRAIPFQTLLKRVKEEPFIPIKWLSEHTGMQGFEELNDRGKELAESAWLLARNRAVEQAEYLDSIKVSKQFVNRLLEPWMWHTVIATGTDWENFFALRAHHMAEIHIQDLAYKMLEEYNKYEFQKLKPGEWHIPFDDKIDEVELYELSNYKTKTGIVSSEIEDFKIEQQGLRVKISVGICAGISYGRIKEKIDIADMIDLHDSLVIRPYSGKRGTRDFLDPIHASPTEHQAKAFGGEDYYSSMEDGLGLISGNFTGFEQYRKMLPNENATDKRVKK